MDLGQGCWGGGAVRYLGSPPGDAHMQGVVTACLGVGHGASALIGVQQGLVPLRQNQINHHGGTSSQSGLWRGELQQIDEIRFKSIVIVQVQS